MSLIQLHGMLRPFAQKIPQNRLVEVPVQSNACNKNCSSLFPLGTSVA